MDVSRSLDSGAPAWQFEPWLALEHDIVQGEGIIPVWNPYSAYGAPLFANMQSQPLSPFAWPAILSRSAVAYDWLLVLRIIVAALFTYAFCRSFFRTAASFCGALSYALSGYFVLYLAMPEQSVYAVAPALFLAIERYARSPRPAAIAWIATAVAALLFGGMPESAFLIIAMASGYAIVRRVYAGPAAGIALGAGLSAVLILPFVEYLRNGFSIHSPGDAPGLLYDHATFGAIASYIAPLIAGPPGNDLGNGFSGWSGVRDYFGVASVTFALSAVLRMRMRRVVWKAFPAAFFLSISAVFLLKRFGVLGFQELGALPVLRQITLVKYAEPLIGFCIATLAAAGVDLYLEDRQVKALVPACATMFAAMGIAVGAAIPYLAPGFPHGAYALGSLLVWAALLLAIIFTARLVERRECSRQSAGAAVGALFAASALLPFVIPMFWIVDRNPDRDVSALLGTDFVRAARASLPDHKRFFSPDALLYPDWAAAFGIGDVRSVDALFTARYLPFVRAFLKKSDPTFLADRFTGDDAIDFRDPAIVHWMELSSIGTIGVRSVVRGLEGRTPFYSANGVLLYTVDKSLPLFAAFSRIRCVDSGAGALAAISGADFEPLDIAVIEGVSGEDCRRRSASAGFVAGHIAVFRSTYERMSISVKERSYVVNSQTNYPGWNAYVDGHWQPMLGANYLFRAVPVEAGTHVIELRYEPESLAIGEYISAIAIVQLVLLLVFDHRLARRKTFEVESP